MLKPNVLRRKNDFSAIYNKGKSVGERYLVFFYKKNGLSYNRIAFLASKKVGKAVIRNRARRLLRESYREFEKKLPLGYDFIFIARKTICGLKCANVKKSMENAIKRSGLLNAKKKRGEF